MPCPLPRHLRVALASSDDFFCAFAPTVRARAWRAAQATAVPRARLEKRTKILVQASEELGAKADEVAAGVTAAELAVRLR